MIVGLAYIFSEGNLRERTILTMWFVDCFIEVLAVAFFITERFA